MNLFDQNWQVLLEELVVAEVDRCETRQDFAHLWWRGFRWPGTEAQHDRHDGFAEGFR